MYIQTKNYLNDTLLKNYIFVGFTKYQLNINVTKKKIVYHVTIK